jgi:hypothetical protein
MQNKLLVHDKITNHTICLEYLERKRYWGDTDDDGRILIKRNLKKCDVGLWTGQSWLKIGTCGGHF